MTAALLLLFLPHRSFSQEFNPLAGYNPYIPGTGGPRPRPPNEKSFKDMPDREGDTPTTEASSSQRAVLAASSNCFKTGGGLVPEYYVCGSEGDGGGPILGKRRWECKCLAGPLRSISSSIHHTAVILPPLGAMS